MALLLYSRSLVDVETEAMEILKAGFEWIPSCLLAAAAVRMDGFKGQFRGNSRAERAEQEQSCCNGSAVMLTLTLTTMNCNSPVWLRSTYWARRVQCNAVPVQFQCSFKAIPERYQWSYGKQMMMNDRKEWNDSISDGLFNLRQVEFQSGFSRPSAVWWRLRSTLSRRRLPLPPSKRKWENQAKSSKKCCRWKSAVFVVYLFWSVSHFLGYKIGNWKFPIHPAWHLTWQLLAG